MCITSYYKRTTDPGKGLSKLLHSALKAWRIPHKLLRFICSARLPIIVLHPRILRHLRFSCFQELTQIWVERDDPRLDHVLIPKFQKLLQTFWLEFCEIMNLARITA